MGRDGQEDGMRIEDVSETNAAGLTDDDLKNLRFRAVQMYEATERGRESLRKNAVGLSTPIGRDTFWAAYRAVDAEMARRGLPWQRTALDEALARRMVRGVDVAELPPIVLREAAVCLTGPFVADPKHADAVDVWLDGEYPAELEKRLAEAVLDQTGKDVAVVEGLADPSIAAYDLVLIPRGKTQEMVKGLVDELNSRKPKAGSGTDKKVSKEPLPQIKSFIKSLEERVVGGVIYAPDEVDGQGDWTTTEEIWKGLKHFMTTARGQMKIMHEGRAIATPIVECFQTDEATVKAGEMLPAGAWYMSVHVPAEHEDLWKAIKAGEITGFSMAGSAEVDHDEDIEKFDPDQSRDENGRWSDGGGGGKVNKETKQKVRTALCDSYGNIDIPFFEGSAKEARAIIETAETMTVKNPSMTVEQIKQNVTAGLGYFGGNFYEMNKALRREKGLGKDRPSQDVKRALPYLAALPSVAAGSTVYRGVKIKEGEIDKFAVGQVKQDRGFVSTSQSRSIAEGFMSSRNDEVSVLLKIKDNRRLGRIAGGSALAPEKEVIYPPGTKIRVTNVSRRKDPYASIEDGDRGWYLSVEGEVL